MSSRLVHVLLVSLIAAWASASVHAQQGGDARSLAATCFTCHGTDGRSAGGVPPGLAGRSRDELLQQMREFRADKRPATIMHQHAKGYSDAQLELIAGYFARVPAGEAAQPAKVGQ
jgi:cytochrome c553